MIERTCAIETGKKQHRSKFEINMHKFEKANYFSNGAHTDESSTCLSGIVRGRERLSHRPLLT